LVNAGEPMPSYKTLFYIIHSISNRTNLLIYTVRFLRKQNNVHIKMPVLNESTYFLFTKRLVITVTAVYHSFIDQQKTIVEVILTEPIERYIDNARNRKLNISVDILIFLRLDSLESKHSKHRSL